MSIKSHRGSGPMKYDDTEFPIKSNSSRKRKLPSRFSDSVMPEKYKRLYDNINRSSIPDEVKNDVIEMVEKEKCKVGVVNDYVEKRSDEKEFNMDDLNDAIEKLGLDGGGVLKALVEQEEADISTAVAEVIRGLKEPPRVESQIALPQVPKSQILMGYVNAIYAKVNTTLDECMRLLWTKDLQAALASYVGGKLALMTISNPGTIASFINTLTTTIAPYVSAGTGILSTVALGTLIRKVFGHYATTTALIAEETKDGILALNTKILTMSDKEVVEALIDQTSNLSRATNDLFQSLKNTRPTDYDALARSLPEIDFNLDKRDKINVGDFANAKRRKINNDPSTVAPTTVAPTTVAGLDAGTMEESDDEESNTAATTTTTGPATGKRKAEEISTSTGSGKRKSKKRQTKNKKNKARKTKKNKRSSKKKVHKKK